jgi:periplasmic divalent cation tolerance protein
MRRGRFEQRSGIVSDGCQLSGPQALAGVLVSWNRRDMSDDYLQVTTTTDSEVEARRLAQLAVESRLAACGQVLSPITSVYRWEGKVENAKEWMVVFKTTANRAEELIDRLRADHSYDTPEIVAVPIVAGYQAYLEWITEETRDPG